MSKSKSTAAAVLEPTAEVEAIAEPAPAPIPTPAGVRATTPAPRGVGGRPVMDERTRRARAVSAELARLEAVASAGDAGAAERVRALRRRLDRIEGGDGMRAELVAEAVADAGGPAVVAAAIVPGMRMNVPTLGRLDGLRVRIKQREIRLHTESIRANPILHPDQVEDMRAELAKDRDAVPALEAKVAEERRREADRLVASALAGASASVAALAASASSAGLGALAHAIVALTPEFVRRRGLELDQAEHPDD